MFSHHQADTNPGYGPGTGGHFAQAESSQVLGWHQHAYDPQRTGWAPFQLKPWIDQPGGSTSWKYAWQRDDLQTRSQYQVYPVAGAGKLYVAAADNTLYAVDLSSGDPVWSISPGGDLYSTPAFDPQSEAVYVTGGANLYRIDQSGQRTHTYSAGVNLETSPLLVGDYVYLTSTDGRLHKVNKHTLSVGDGGWIYDPGVSINQTTMPSYSASRGLVIYASDPDLKVRAVDEVTGELRWAFAAPNTYRCIEGSDWMGEQCVEFRHGWPVVADQEGVVFARLRMTYQDSWDFSGYYDDPEFPIPPGMGQSPANNVEIRQLLQQRRDIQPLFALDLDTGQEAFIPLVKSSGFFDGYLNHGPMPAIRTLPDGHQVAYLLFSTSKTCHLAGDPQTTWCGNREDTTVGEMVLNDLGLIRGCDSASRVCQAGELRYVDFFYIVRGDEHGFLSGSGDTVFHSNWYSVLEGATIIDRSQGLGATWDDPIKTVFTPFVIDQETSCDCAYTSSHYCQNRLIGEGKDDCNMGRYFPEGFYFYKTTDYADTSGWNINPYVMVSDGYIIVRNIDASLMAIRAQELP